eukprot:403337449
MQGYMPYGPTNPLLTQGQNARAYHAMAGSKKKKAIDQSLMELKKKFNITSDDHNEDEGRSLLGKRDRIQSFGNKATGNFEANPRIMGQKRFSDTAGGFSDKQQSQPQKSFNPLEISQIVADNADYLMQQVTNIYVGNLSSEVTEETLAKVFCKFGEIESVKIMLPRNEEDRKKKRNCGFIKFYKYESAFLAKEAMNEHLLDGMSMRINWGKGINSIIRNNGLLVDYQGVVGDQDLEMQYVENQLNLIIMGHELLQDDSILESEYNYFPQHLQRIHVKIPEDCLTRYQIDKFAKFIAKEGFQFEEEIKYHISKGKNLENQIIKQIILKEDEELSNYYQWRSYSYFNGDSTHSWSQHPFQLYQNGPIWIPPRNKSDSMRLNPAQAIKEKMLKQTKHLKSAIEQITHGNDDEEDQEMQNVDDLDEQLKKQKEQQGFIPLGESDRLIIETFIANIKSTKRQICEGMIMAMEYAQNARDIAELLTSAIISQIEETSKELDIKSIFAKIFLISDILHNSSNPQISAAWTYRREFEQRLSNVFDSLNKLWRVKIEGKLSQKQVKKQSMRLLKIWRDNNIYEARVIEGWEATLKIDKSQFYSFNLTDGEFQPSDIKDKKILDKMKQIVLPELRAYYRRLKETNQSQPGVLERECKLSGVPLSTNTTDLIERLVALQEYKIRKVLKSKLRSELQTLDEHSNKDIQMTQYLHQTIRKPLNVLDDTLKEDSLLNQEQRKSIVDKAIQDIIQDIVKIRSTYLKIQQSLMQIDEKSIDGKEIQDFELNLFEINSKNLERNEKLIAIAQRALEKGSGQIDLDNLSLDSDELITTQEDIQDNEDIDGVELSDSDEIFQKNTEKEDTFSAIISSDHLKQILKYARQKRLLMNKRQHLKSQTSGNKHLDQELLSATEQLDNQRLQYNRAFEKLEEKDLAYQRLIRFKRRLEKDFEQFELNLYNSKNRYNDFEKQLKLTKEKLNMYRLLNERFKQEEIEKKTKEFQQSSSQALQTQDQKKSNSVKVQDLRGQPAKNKQKRRQKSNSSSNSDSSSSLENSDSSKSSKSVSSKNNIKRQNGSRDRSYKREARNDKDSKQKGNSYSKKEISKDERKYRRSRSRDRDYQERRARATSDIRQDQRVVNRSESQQHKNMTLRDESQRRRSRSRDQDSMSKSAQSKEIKLIKLDSDKNDSAQKAQADDKAQKSIFERITLNPARNQDQIIDQNAIQMSSDNSGRLNFELKPQSSNDLSQNSQRQNQQDSRGGKRFDNNRNSRFS